MEPEDIPVHDLLGVGSDPTPGPDELRAIVSRAGRKRWGTAAVAATLALGLGLGVGFATSGSSSPATQTATGGAAPTEANGAAGAPNPATGSAFPSYGGTSATAPTSAAPHLNKLFTRTTGGVTIRAFLLNFPKISGLPASCGVQGAHLQVEVSSASMVGIVGGGPTAVDRAQSASGIWSEVVGTAEGTPTVIVTAATGPGVTEVSMSFPGRATDQMAPVGGWVALAAPVSSAPSYGQTLGTLSERRANGTLVASQTVQLGVLPGAVKAAPCGPVFPCIGPQTQTPSASSGGTSTNATTVPAKACAALPCAPLPGVSSSPPTGQGTASASPPSVMIVKPARPAIACALHPPAASGGSSGTSGSKP
jgi:hypothetical protein